MEIQIFHGIEEGKKATGLTVVIDVFRAFSSACFAINAGATNIIPVKSTEEALTLKTANPEYILMGEEKGFKAPGFDFGNSPTELCNATLTGKTIVQRTSCGTQGIVNATNASEIITGSFVNFSAIVQYIRSQNINIISLLATDAYKNDGLDEDVQCAQALKEALESNTMPSDVPGVLKKSSAYANLFLKPEVTSHPLSDFHLCAELDRFNFILRLNKLGALEKVNG